MAMKRSLKLKELLGNRKLHWMLGVSRYLLIIWEQDDDLKEIILIRVGSHSELS